MGLILRRLMNLWRKVFGQGSAVEKRLRRAYIRFARRSMHGHESRIERSARSFAARTRLTVRGEYTGRTETVFRGGKGDDRVGIYMLGACDLPATFVAKPFIREHLNGICAIIRDGEVFDSRSDFLLQLHDNPPTPEMIQQVSRRLRLPANAFESRLFDPGFTVKYLEKLGEFPKSAVVMSINGDATRTLYRHKEHGYVLDPGGWWLSQPMEEVLGDLDRVRYINETFVKVPRLSLEDFSKSFGRVVDLVKEKTGAEVLVFTTSSVDPNSREHNFGVMKAPQPLRRREFNIAVAELSRQHDFALVDVDGVLKREGIREQLDYGHFPLERMEAIAREVTRALRDREVI